MATTTQETSKKRSSNGTKRPVRISASQMHVATHEAIAARAYELYVKSGYQPGRELEFWFEAERQLLQRSGH